VQRRLIWLRRSLVTVQRRPAGRGLRKIHWRRQTCQAAPTHIYMYVGGVRGLRGQACDPLTRSAAAQGCANAVGAWMRWSGRPLLQGEGVLIVGLAGRKSGVVGTDRSSFSSGEKDGMRGIQIEPRSARAPHPLRRPLLHGEGVLILGLAERTRGVVGTDRGSFSRGKKNGMRGFRSSGALREISPSRRPRTSIRRDRRAHPCRRRQAVRVAPSTARSSRTHI
jgi:hypothetical protein